MKNLIYLLILVIAFSCNKEEIKKPKNFIEKDKMIDLILDMKIAEKARTVNNKNKKKYQNYMSLVYEKYHIDSTQFKENNDYYISHLEQYETIYKEVQKRIKDSLVKYKRIVKIKDSLDRVKRKLAKKEIEIGPDLMLEMEKETTNPKIKSTNKK